MSRTLDDPRDLDLPPRWRSWSHPARAQFLMSNLSRSQLFRAIVLQVEFDDLAAEDVDEHSRFRKEHLAKIALRLGMFKQ